MNTDLEYKFEFIDEVIENNTDLDILSDLDSEFCSEFTSIVDATTADDFVSSYWDNLTRSQKIYIYCIYHNLPREEALLDILRTKLSTLEAYLQYIESEREKEVSKYKATLSSEVVDSAWTDAKFKEETQIRETQEHVEAHRKTQQQERVQSDHLSYMLEYENVPDADSAYIIACEQSKLSYEEKFEKVNESISSVKLLLQTILENSMISQHDRLMSVMNESFVTAQHMSIDLQAGGAIVENYDLYRLLTLVDSLHDFTSVPNQVIIDACKPFALPVINVQKINNETNELRFERRHEVSSSLGESWMCSVLNEHACIGFIDESIVPQNELDKKIAIDAVQFVENPLYQTNIQYSHKLSNTAVDYLAEFEKTLSDTKYIGSAATAKCDIWFQLDSMKVAMGRAGEDQRDSFKQIVRLGQVVDTCSKILQKFNTEETVFIMDQSNDPFNKLLFAVDKVNDAIRRKFTIFEEEENMTIPLYPTRTWRYRVCDANIADGTLHVLTKNGSLINDHAELSCERTGAVFDDRDNVQVSFDGIEFSENPYSCITRMDILTKDDNVPEKILHDEKGLENKPQLTSQCTKPYLEKEIEEYIKPKIYGFEEKYPEKTREWYELSVDKRLNDVIEQLYRKELRKTPDDRPRLIEAYKKTKRYAVLRDNCAMTFYKLSTYTHGIADSDDHVFDNILDDVDILQIEKYMARKRACDWGQVAHCKLNTDSNKQYVLVTPDKLLSLYATFQNVSSIHIRRGALKTAETSQASVTVKRPLKDIIYQNTISIFCPNPSARNEEDSVVEIVAPIIEPRKEKYQQAHTVSDGIHNVKPAKDHYDTPFITGDMTVEKLPLVFDSPIPRSSGGKNRNITYDILLGATVAIFALLGGLQG